MKKNVYLPGSFSPWLQALVISRRMRVTELYKKLETILPTPEVAILLVHTPHRHSNLGVRARFPLKKTSF